MTWPTGNVSLTNLDAGSDSMSAARADLYDAVNKLNLMINNGPGTGTITVYNDDNVRAYLPTHNANVAATYFVGDGRYLSNINTANVISNYGNANVAAYLPTYTGNLSATNITSTGITALKQYTETVYAIGNTGTSTITPNVSNGAVQTMTATGNFSLAAPVGMATGSSLSLIIRQDSTGSRIATFNSAYKFAGATKTLSTGAGSIDMINIFYDGINFLCGLSKGFA